MNQISNEDDECWIPCEICDSAVRFSDYINHVRVCSRPLRLIQIRIQNTVEDSANEDDGHEEGEVEDQPHPFLMFQTVLQQTRNNQLDLLANMFGSFGLHHNSYEMNSMIAEQLGTVETGVTDFESIIEIVKDTKEQICAICQDEIKTNMVQLKKCHHYYCKECIYEWLKRSKKCPICACEQE